MESNKEQKQSAAPQQEENLDLSKTVPISAEEEQKLGAFLQKFQASIKGDEEMEGIFGNTINKWSN